MGGRRSSVLKNKNSTPCKLHYEILSVSTRGQEGREGERKEGIEGWWGQEGRLRTLKEKLCSRCTVTLCHSALETLPLCTGDSANLH